MHHRVPSHFNWTLHIFVCNPGGGGTATVVLKIYGTTVQKFGHPGEQAPWIYIQLVSSDVEIRTLSNILTLSDDQSSPNALLRKVRAYALHLVHQTNGHLCSDLKGVVKCRHTKIRTVASR